MKAFILVVSGGILVIVAIVIAASYRGAFWTSGVSMSVTGCLQEGAHARDYILTHLNEPPIPSGHPARRNR